MTHVVCQPCYNCKYTDCVVVCPVACFYEGEQMLYIHPEECIDCDAVCRSVRWKRFSWTKMFPTSGAATSSSTRRWPRSVRKSPSGRSRSAIPRGSRDWRWNKAGAKSCADVPVDPFQPNLPGRVLGAAQFHHQQRIVVGLDGPVHQFHLGLVRRPAPLVHVALDASADEVFPRGQAPAAARNHVVDAQLLRGEMPAAVLAAMVVPGQNVAPTQTQLLLGQPIVREQADHPRHLNLEIDRPNPVVVGLLARA